jgi:hypothetical protein
MRCSQEEALNIKQWKMEYGNVNVKAVVELLILWYPRYVVAGVGLVLIF